MAAFLIACGRSSELVSLRTIVRKLDLPCAFLFEACHDAVELKPLF